MSYYCKLCFKQIQKTDVLDFFQQMKAEALNKLPEIAEENRSYSPLMRAHDFSENFEISRELRDKTIDWAAMHVFTHKYFYCDDLGVLAVFNVPKPMESIFDCVVHFQNSTDQNYDFETWEGIEVFNEAVLKWKEATNEEIQARYTEIYGDWGHDPEEMTEQRWDYYRKTCLYKDIWKHFEGAMYSEELPYLATLRRSDYRLLQVFYTHVVQEVEKVAAEFRADMAKEKN